MNKTASSAKNRYSDVACGIVIEDSTLNSRTIPQSTRETARSLSLAVTILTVVGYAAQARADRQRGLSLSQQWCSECHGVLPDQGSANAKAPPFAAIGREPSATEYALRTFLRVPHATMPNFVLQPDDVADIVDYIVSLKGR